MTPDVEVRTWKDYLFLTLNGFLIGSSDIVPGVSGGTMAFILGIYDELINAIRAVVPFLRKLLKREYKAAFEEFPWRFLMAVGIGVLIAILSLARFLHWALDEHPSLIYSVFFGLIVASVLVVRSRVHQWNTTTIGTVVLSTAFTYIIVGLTPAETPTALWFIFISGAVAICAMILPGLSGAFILLLLGKYQYILNALLSLDIPVILVFMVGAGTGIITFSNVLRWLLDHYHDLTVATLIGFMLGALREVWPWKTYDPTSSTSAAVSNVLPPTFTTEVGLALGLMALGFTGVLIIEYFASRGKARQKTLNEQHR